MAGPQRSEPEDTAAATHAEGVGLPAFDLEIAPLRPVTHTASYASAAPNYGPLQRGRYKPAGLTSEPAPVATPDTSPAGRALDALAALLATPLDAPAPVASPVVQAAPVTAPAAKIVEPDVMVVADEQAGEPEVGFATTAIEYAVAPVTAPITAPVAAVESTARATMAITRAAFEMIDSLPDLLPQLQSKTQAEVASLPDLLPFGSVTYRLFVM